jgi:hypothetical protein
MKFNAYILSLLFGLFSNIAMAESYTIKLSELGFTDFLPITGSCEMDLNGLITDFPGSQLCIASERGSIAHYRLIGSPNTNFSIQVNGRVPVDYNQLTFTPVGKITSDVSDIDIIPGQAHTANSGSLGRIDIKFGGQIILSTAFNPNVDYEIQLENVIIWSEIP